MSKKQKPSRTKWYQQNSSIQSVTLIVLVTLLLFSACSSHETASVLEVASTEIPTSTEVPTSTATIAHTQTETPLPTLTLTPSQTPTPTQEEAEPRERGESFRETNFVIDRSFEGVYVKVFACTISSYGINEDGLVVISASLPFYYGDMMREVEFIIDSDVYFGKYVAYSTSETGQTYSPEEVRDIFEGEGEEAIEDINHPFSISFSFVGKDGQKVDITNNNVENWIDNPELFDIELAGLTEILPNE
jgi:hypothetical protein